MTTVGLSANAACANGTRAATRAASHAAIEPHARPTEHRVTQPLPFMPSLAPGRGDRWLARIEAFGVFLMGVVLMNFFYAASAPITNGKVGPIGVPEHDSWYHVAMASMLPEHGLLAKFPWLQFTWFRNAGDDFVSHHWGFHLLMSPFVKLSEWLNGGDALAGGRWAMAFVLGVNAMLFHMLLRQRRVPLHWLWMAAFLLLPDQFFARQGYVRAIGSSLIFMQLTLLLLFSGRYVWAAIVLALYVHLYLGAVMYGPMIVAIFALCQAIGAREDRAWPWRMVGLTAAGWAIGVVTYPYAAGMWEFLYMQVFGSGLSPDIEVGREWRPYTDAWVLPSMAWPLMVGWVAALLLRLRMGPRLEARDAALLLIQFLFLTLTFKARRFIEYWPIMALLSTAYLASAPLEQMLAAVRERWARLGQTDRSLIALVSLTSASLAAIVLIARLAKSHDTQLVLAEWKSWLAIIAILLLPTIVRIWTSREPTDLDTFRFDRLFGVVGSGAALLALGCGLALVVGNFLQAGPPDSKSLNARLAVPGLLLGVLVAAYGLVPALLSATPAGGRRSDRKSAIGSTAAAVLCAVLLPATALAAGAPTLMSASRQMRCNYDMDDVRELMAFLKKTSAAGDTIFTDDWDTFPLFFYFNRHNHYIVGLDPKFTHQRDPDLWNRYVKISRGEVPATIRLASKPGETRQATVDLADIRTHFRCKYVVADRDHRRMADALNRNPQLAEFVYPDGSYETSRNAPYVVFRMREPGEKVAPAASAAAPSQWPVYLSRIRPFSASQGWGDLASDRSVDGNRLSLRGRKFDRGIGTHAPARLTYDVPTGAKFFECLVGIDDETDGHGSAELVILLDGKPAFQSKTLRHGEAPVTVKVPLGDAKQVMLNAETTADGQRFDHVDLVEARFTGDESP